MISQNEIKRHKASLRSEHYPMTPKKMTRQALLAESKKNYPDGSVKSHPNYGVRMYFGDYQGLFMPGHGTPQQLAKDFARNPFLFGEDRLGMTNELFEKLDKLALESNWEEIATRVKPFLDRYFSRGIADALVAGWSQYPGGFVAQILTGCRTEGSTVCIFQPESGCLNITMQCYLNEEWNLILECNCRNFPVMNLAPGIEDKDRVGDIVGPIKTTFVLKEQDRSWGFELVKIETDSASASLVFGALTGCLFEDREILAYIHLSKLFRLLETYQQYLENAIQKDPNVKRFLDNHKNPDNGLDTLSTAVISAHGRNIAHHLQIGRATRLALQKYIAMRDLRDTLDQLGLSVAQKIRYFKIQFGTKRNVIEQSRDNILPKLLGTFFSLGLAAHALWAVRGKQVAKEIEKALGEIEQILQQRSTKAARSTYCKLK